MNVAGSAPHVTCYRNKDKRGNYEAYGTPTPQSTNTFLPRWKTHPCILYHVCYVRGQYFDLDEGRNVYSLGKPNVVNV